MRTIYPFARFLVVLLMLGMVTSCGEKEAEKKPEKPVLLQSSFSDLTGWQEDNIEEALSAFRHSCIRIIKNASEKPFGPDGIGGVYGDWQPACEDLLSSGEIDARAFFEKHFTPYKVTINGEASEGLFTGYYEAALKGSQTPDERYHVKLHKKPDDLVMVDLGLFRESLKGQRIAGRVVSGHLRPYEARGDIASGKWPHDDKVLVYVDDPVDAFFLHIQGSGRVDLPDGTHMRVGYDGQNGHPYYAIGRELVKRGHMAKEDVTMQSIRSWLSGNPDSANEVMDTNASYIFFRELKEGGPLGGEGTVLTEGRSLAIDRTIIPYGVPVWLQAGAPAENEAPLNRLMVAQDTGGAITGVVRGDVFWGHGERAEFLAGHMKSTGSYWLLLPNQKP